MVSLTLEVAGAAIGQHAAHDGELLAEIIAGLADNAVDPDPSLFAFEVARELSEEHLSYLQNLVALIDLQWRDLAARGDV